MKSPSYIAITAVFIVGVFTACISAPPLRYYTLEWSLNNPEETRPVWLQVTSIKLAEPLKRKEIMIRKSSVEIEYYSTHLWASSLEELLTHKLNQCFMCKNSEKNSPDLYLHIEVLNFEVIETSPETIVNTKFIVQFLNPADMKLLNQKIYTVEKKPEGKEVKDFVKALSLCVDEITAHIYKDASQLIKTS